VSPEILPNRFIGINPLIFRDDFHRHHLRIAQAGGKALTPLHDYGKIMQQSATEASVNGTRFLVDHGVHPELTQSIINRIETIDRKDVNELMAATIEIQILSSADGAAHMVGPCFSIYWWENSDRSIEALQSSNRKKLQTDWERKIVLPEVKQAFASRYHDLRGNFGDETVSLFKF
jgi:hypothetical protein